MTRRKIMAIVMCLILALPAIAAAAGQKAPAVKSGATHDDLIAMFRELREIEKPVMTADGIPDYTPAGVKAQKRKLDAFKKRLAAIDTSAWPIPDKADYLLVRAEANGLEFDHRVIRPWSRDPGYYAVFGQFQPVRYGTLELPRLPIPPERVAEFRAQLQAVPKVLEQGRKNLTEPAADLALLAIDFKNKEIARLKSFRAQLAEQNLGPRPRHGQGHRGHRSLQGLAGKGHGQDGPPGRRRDRELQLVHQERLAAALHLAGSPGHLPKRARAGHLGHEARGTQEPGAPPAQGHHGREGVHDALQRIPEVPLELCPGPGHHECPRLHEAPAHRHMG